jgi:hypothetical protein
MAARAVDRDLECARGQRGDGDLRDCESPRSIAICTATVPDLPGAATVCTVGGSAGDRGGVVDGRGLGPVLAACAAVVLASPVPVTRDRKAINVVVRARQSAPPASGPYDSCPLRLGA